MFQNYVAMWIYLKICGSSSSVPIFPMFSRHFPFFPCGFNKHSQTFTNITQHCPLIILIIALPHDPNLISLRLPTVFQRFVSRVERMAHLLPPQAAPRVRVRIHATGLTELPGEVSDHETDWIFQYFPYTNYINGHI